jgi:hypothetical protein
VPQAGRFQPMRSRKAGVPHRAAASPPGAGLIRRAATDGPERS